MLNKKLYLHHRQSNIKTLGPGNRYVIWTQGCIHFCKNCIAPESHPLDINGYYIDIESLANEILENAKLEKIRGITISGGEPFLQAEQLTYLIKYIKEHRIDLDFIVFTGFEYSQLRKMKNENIDALLDNIDILIDGKYEESLNENNYLRGSSNQNIIHLSNKYSDYTKEMMRLKSRNIELIMLDKDRVFIAGIPDNSYEKNNIDIEVLNLEVKEK